MTLVIATTIPLSVMMTFIAMKIGGYNIDLVTLISLSLSVGLMVDAAIVVLESIYQQREKGVPLVQAIQKGTSEVFTPVLASQLTIVVVFLPLRAELILPAGSSLDEAQRVALAADQTLKELPDVQDIYLEAYKDRAVLNIIILGKSKRELDKDAITLEINRRLQALAGLQRVELGWGGGESQTPIALDVTGKDLTVMKQVTDQLVEMLQSIAGVQNPRSQFSSGEEKIILVPKREALERLQIDQQSLLSQLRGFLGEQTVATMTVNGVPS